MIIFEYRSAQFIYIFGYHIVWRSLPTIFDAIDTCSIIHVTRRRQLLSDRDGRRSKCMRRDNRLVPNISPIITPHHPHPLSLSAGLNVSHQVVWLRRFARICYTVWARKLRRPQLNLRKSVRRCPQPVR